MEFMPTLSAPAEPMLDHALLIAGVAVTQASTRTAVLAERMVRQHAETGFADSLKALVQVFTAEDATAAAQLQGSFHPRIAGAAAGKTRSSFMKPGFTLAF
jgi:hypothetical protein